MRHILIPALCLASVLACRPGGRKTGGAAAENAQVETVSFLDAEGRRGSLADFKGKVVIVDVWATWCPPCRRSLPEVAALQGKGGGDFVVLAISVDREGFLAVKPFLSERPELGLKAVVPENSQALAPFGAIDGIPTTLVIDRKGRVRERWSGFYPGRAEQALQAALADS